MEDDNIILAPKLFLLYKKFFKCNVQDSTNNNPAYKEKKYEKEKAETTARTDHRQSVYTAVTSLITLCCYYLSFFLSGNISWFLPQRLFHSFPFRTLLISVLIILKYTLAEEGLGGLGYFISNINFLGYESGPDGG